MVLDFLLTTGVGSRVGPRAVQPETGDEEAEGHGSKEMAEDGELGGEAAMNEGEG